MIEAGFFLTAGTAAFVETFLASRGNHSRIHKNILAPIALGAEGLTALSGLGLAISTEENQRNYFRNIGRAGIGVTVLSHLAVILTDTPISSHIQSGKRFGREDLLDLGNSIFADLRRQIKDGFNLVTNSGS